MQNSLDDIFGSSPPHAHDHPPSTTTTTTAPQNEPSDLPSLRRQHVTAGYRDGLAASKSTQVQSGFDAGFPVGAQLGMRVGTILGILEGAIRGLEAPSRKGVRKVGAGGSATTKKGAGVPGRDVAAMGIGFEDLDSGAVGEGAGGATTTGLGSSAAAAAAPTPEETPREKKRAELLGLYRRAVRELDIRKVFEGVGGSADELAGDGGELAEGIGKQQEMPETKLARQAEAVVAAWERRVQVALWEENMEALELKEVVG